MADKYDKTKDPWLKKRALTPDQKKDILVRLYRIWHQNSDLRLGQLLSIVFEQAIQNPLPQTEEEIKKYEPFTHRMCLFSKEDFTFIEELEDHYLTKRRKGKN